MLGVVPGVLRFRVNQELEGNVMLRFQGIVAKLMEAKSHQSGIITIFITAPQLRILSKEIDGVRHYFNSSLTQMLLKQAEDITTAVQEVTSLSERKS